MAWRSWSAATSASSNAYRVPVRAAIQPCRSCWLKCVTWPLNSFELSSREPAPVLSLLLAEVPAEERDVVWDVNVFEVRRDSWLLEEASRLCLCAGVVHRALGWA